MVELDSTELRPFSKMVVLRSALGQKRRLRKPLFSLGDAVRKSILVFSCIMYLALSGLRLTFLGVEIGIELK